MVVFQWEQKVADWVTTLPRSGFLYDFMFFLSYPGRWGWFLWVLLILLVFRRRLREMITPLGLALLAILLGDLASRRLVKAFVLRLRPHYLGQSCDVAHCWGFVSSHSTNIVAFSTVLCLYDAKNLYWAAPVTLAIFISLIYLLDHYPLDVVGGGTLGFLVGSLVYFAARSWKGGRWTKHTCAKL